MENLQNNDMEKIIIIVSEVGLKSTKSVANIDGDMRFFNYQTDDDSMKLMLAKLYEETKCKKFLMIMKCANRELLKEDQFLNIVIQDEQGNDVNLEIIQQKTESCVPADKSANR